MSASAVQVLSFKMEEWQKDHINRNLDYLIENTVCSVKLLACLVARKIIDPTEKEEIEGFTNRQKQSSRLYSILPGRITAFDTLKEVLLECRQSGAYRILQQCNGQESWKRFGPIEFDKSVLLGNGNSFNQVYRGRMGFRDPIAVKKIKCDNRSQDHVMREVEILQKLPSHSNVIQFFHAEIVPQKFLLIALELCTNTLEECVGDKKYPIPENLILLQATSGLEFLHSNNIIHRDLKPSNILLKFNSASYTLVKISDFDKSKLIEAPRYSSTASQAVGTNRWFAPEVLRHSNILQTDSAAKLVLTFKSDVFPLGCIFYYVTTDGLHPFGDPVSCNANIIDGKVKIEHSLVKTNFEGMISVILKMVSNNPSQRPTCTEILNSFTLINKRPNEHEATTKRDDSSNENENKLGGSADVPLSSYDLCTETFSDGNKPIMADQEALQTCLHEYNEEMSSYIYATNSILDLNRMHTRLLAEFKTRGDRATSLEFEPLLTRIIEERFEIIQRQFDKRVLRDQAYISPAITEADTPYKSQMYHVLGKNPYKHDLQRSHQDIVRNITSDLSKKYQLTSSQTRYVKTHLNDTYQDTLENFVQPDRDLAVGIDLGSSKCSLAVYVNGEVQQIRNEQGQFYTPSYLRIEENGNTVFGQEAKYSAEAYPETTISNFKDLLLNASRVSKGDPKTTHLPFKTEAKNGDLFVIIKNTRYTPEQVYTIIFKHLKLQAEMALGCSIKKAVITVPAYYTNALRNMVKVSAKDAKLEVLGVLDEPTAVALTFQMQFPQETPIVALIFDLGAVSLNVAVVSLNGSNTKVLYVDGTEIGGDSFDRNVMDMCIRALKEEYNVDLLGDLKSRNKHTQEVAQRRLRRLRLACENHKRFLSSYKDTIVTLDELLPGVDLNVKISQDDFNAMNMEIFMETIHIADNATKCAEINIHEVQEIIPVGGSVRIPKLQQLLVEWFPRSRIHNGVNPEEAVAIGAALHAAVLNGSMESISKLATSLGS